MNQGPHVGHGPPRQRRPPPEQPRHAHGVPEHRPPDAHHTPYHCMSGYRQVRKLVQIPSGEQLIPSGTHAEQPVRPSHAPIIQEHDHIPRGELGRRYVHLIPGKNAQAHALAHGGEPSGRKLWWQIGDCHLLVGLHPSRAASGTSPKARSLRVGQWSGRLGVRLRAVARTLGHSGWG